MLVQWAHKRNRSSAPRALRSHPSVGGQPQTAPAMQVAMQREAM